MQSSFASAEILVIANKAHNNVLLKQFEIQEIFLGKKKKIGNWKIDLIDQSTAKEIYQRFYKSLLNKNAAEIQAYWAELVFSGWAKAPQVVEDDQAVINYVSNNPNSLGYVSEKTELSKVSIIYRLSEH